MSEKDKKKSGLIFSCWIVAALIVLIAFLVNGNTIVSNLKSTDFFGRVFGSTPEFVKNHKEDATSKSNGLLEIEIETQTPVVSPKTENQIVTQEPVISEPKNEPLPAEVEKSEDNAIAKTPEIKNPSAQEKPVVEETKQIPVQPPKTINLKLYFVLIDTDGSINRKEVSRASTRRDAPLTASIEALLSGPTVSERNSNFKSLIPQGTRLLGASVKNGIATLNFSEEFEFNAYGVEGYLGQLMQIVYTATSFSTVECVQFLIEGQKKEYLGSEGVRIGTPLARSSF